MEIDGKSLFKGENRGAKLNLLNILLQVIPQRTFLQITSIQLDFL